MNLQAHPAKNRSLKILVADDDIINQRVARKLLTEMGHTGIVVGDGEKALRCLQKFQFDAVLMDVMMPVMDGLQTVAAIREEERATGKHQIIIMVTSHNEPGDDVRFKFAGADGYIAKPIDAAALNEALRRLAPS
jgi:CheY-like chemotaxis protein